MSDALASNEEPTEPQFSETAIEIGRMLDYFGNQGASDIHLNPVRGVWYVKDKSTMPFEQVPTVPPATIDALIEEFAHGGLTHFLVKGQADCSFDIGGHFRGRMAARRTIAGTTITIRIISRRIPTTQELKLPESLVEAIRRPAGLLLFTGQTGSGKSTSIAALVNEINLTEPSAIYTLEDPIEYVYPAGRSLVNQREVGDHVRTFAEGIQNAKRSHPKIIIVGEIVNADTAAAAVDAAASGHLVVSTMHAGSTAEAIDGLISMFPPNEQPLMRTQLAQVLLSVVVQNLIPKIGGGLAMAQEIAHNTNTFSEMIRGAGGDGGDMKLVQQHLLGGGRQERMVAMETALTNLVKAGDVEPETARLVARDQRVINDLLTTAGFPAPQKD
jgi:twitching motility protein PilT